MRSAAATRALCLGALPLVLAACGGGGSNAGYYPAPPPVASQLPASCAAASGASVQEAYPAVGATGISASLPQVVLSAGGVLQSTAYVILVPNGRTVAQGSYIFGAVTAQSSGSLPTGTTMPAYAHPSYYASANQASVTLPVNVLISVYLADSEQSCSPALLGTFST